jgi:hypothetical protein
LAVDILIDNFTDCLVERNTDTIVETEYKERLLPIDPTEFRAWKFDWSATERQGYSIYELFVKGDKEVQGRISLKIDGGVANVDIVETAPHNYGHNGKYIGVGGHMFAIACQCS